MIFETDTNFTRIYATVNGVTGWKLAPLLAVPAVQVQQGSSQTLSPGGPTVLVWNVVKEDNNYFTTAGNQTQFVVRDAGLYNVSMSVQWGTEYCPNQSQIYLAVNGQQTPLGTYQFLRGESFTPGFSQTLSASGTYRFAANDVATVNAQFTAGSTIADSILTFVQNIQGIQVNPNASLTSRFSMVYQGP